MRSFAALNLTIVEIARIAVISSDIIGTMAKEPKLRFIISPATDWPKRAIVLHHWHQKSLGLMLLLQLLLLLLSIWGQFALREPLLAIRDSRPN